MTINFIGATKAAIFQTLRQLETNANLTAILGAPVGVYTHTPQNTQPPFLKLGPVSSEMDPENYDQVEKITIEIQGIWRGPGDGPLTEMMNYARSLLDGQHIPSDVVAIQPPYCLTIEVGDAAIDGLTYVAVMNVEMMVEPA